MNQQLENFAREELKLSLELCNKKQQFMFKRMYSHSNLKLPINKIIDSLPIEKLDWAMQQVERTLSK